MVCGLSECGNTCLEEGFQTFPPHNKWLALPAQLWRNVFSVGVNAREA